MSKCKVNQAAANTICSMIEANQYVLNSKCGTAQPSMPRENDDLQQHG